MPGRRIEIYASAALTVRELIFFHEKKTLFLILALIL
jgi:hypothetical protein